MIKTYINKTTDLLLKLKILGLIILLLTCTSCGFHLQHEKFSFPGATIYLQTNNPYSNLAQALKRELRANNITVTTTPPTQGLILTILSDTNTQTLISSSNTQQTNQYNLQVNVIFNLSTHNQTPIIGPESLIEIRTLTVQASQVLGSSTESLLLYPAMRSAIAHAIIQRITSPQVTKLIRTTLKNNFLPT